MKRLPVPLVLLASLCGCAMLHQEQPSPAMLGNPAPPTAAAAHTITIQPTTRWVNVTGGDTVRFVEGDKSFAWTFNVAANVNSFDLNLVAPPGVLDHTVRVYLAPDPRYIGGRDGRGGHGGHGGGMGGGTGGGTGGGMGGGAHR